MSQSPYIIAMDGTWAGETIRVRLDEIHAALASHHLATVEPGTTDPETGLVIPRLPGMTWFNGEYLRLRNQADSAWLILGRLVDGAWIPYVGSLPMVAPVTVAFQLAGTTDPGPGHNAAAGYGRGSLWFNGAASPIRIWAYVGETAGVAVWRRIDRSTFSELADGIAYTSAEAGKVPAVTADGAGLEWIAPGGAKLLASVDTSVGGISTATLDDAAIEDYPRLVLRAIGIGPAIDGNTLIMQLKAGGTWMSGGTDYAWRGTGADRDGQYWSELSDASAHVRLCRLNQAGNAAGEMGRWEISIDQVNASVVCAGSGCWRNTQGRIEQAAALHAMTAFSGPIQGVRLAWTTGTFAASGIIELRGLTV